MHSIYPSLYIGVVTRNQEEMIASDENIFVADVVQEDDANDCANADSDEPSIESEGDDEGRYALVKSSTTSNSDSDAALCEKLFNV